MTSIRLDRAASAGTRSTSSPSAATSSASAATSSPSATTSSPTAATSSPTATTSSPTATTSSLSATTSSLSATTSSPSANSLHIICPSEEESASTTTAATAATLSTSPSRRPSAENNSTDREANNTASETSAPVEDWGSVPGLPYRTRSLESLQELTRCWDNHGKQCPHPSCHTRLGTNTQLYAHWYGEHMAPGCCRVYRCDACHGPSETFRSTNRAAFVQHLRRKHFVTDKGQSAAIAGYMDAMWESRFSENGMLAHSMPSLAAISTQNRKLFRLEVDESMEGSHIEEPIIVKLNGKKRKITCEDNDIPPNPKQQKVKPATGTSLFEQGKTAEYNLSYPHPQHREFSPCLGTGKARMDHCGKKHKNDSAGDMFVCETVHRHMVGTRHVKPDDKTEPETNPSSLSSSSLDSLWEAEYRRKYQSSPSNNTQPCEITPESFDLDLDQIPPERQRVGNLPWKGMSGEKTNALAEAWQAAGGQCPHSHCHFHPGSRKTLLSHWHQHHLAPGCGIPYKCYGRQPDAGDRPCDRVFDNMEALVEHARHDHRYPDSTVLVLLEKVRAVRYSGVEQEHLPPEPTRSPQLKPARYTRMGAFLNKPIDDTNNPLVPVVSESPKSPSPPPQPPASKKPLGVRINPRADKPGRGHIVNAILAKIQAKVSPSAKENDNSLAINGLEATLFNLKSTNKDEAQSCDGIQQTPSEPLNLVKSPSKSKSCRPYQLKASKLTRSGKPVTSARPPVSHITKPTLDLSYEDASLAERGRSKSIHVSLNQAGVPFIQSSPPSLHATSSAHRSQRAAVTPPVTPISPVHSPCSPLDLTSHGRKPAPPYSTPPALTPISPVQSNTLATRNRTPPPLIPIPISPVQSNSHGTRNRTPPALIPIPISPLHNNRGTRTRTPPALIPICHGPTTPTLSTRTRTPPTQKPASPAAAAAASPVSSAPASMLLSHCLGGYKSDIPMALWEPILLAWEWDLRCPNPNCKGKREQYRSHVELLSHWLVAHIERPKLRLYPCLLRSGIEPPKPAQQQQQQQEQQTKGGRCCYYVFSQRAGLYDHFMTRHGLSVTQVRSRVEVIDRQWALLEKRQREEKREENGERDKTNVRMAQRKRQRKATPSPSDKPFTASDKRRIDGVFALSISEGITPDRKACEVCATSLGLAQDWATVRSYVIGRIENSRQQT